MKTLNIGLIIQEKFGHQKRIPPTDIKIYSNKVEWDTSNKAVGYNIYKVNEQTKSKSDKEDLTFLTYTTSNSYEDGEINETDKYLISSVDGYDLESVPSGEGYNGYPKPLTRTNHIKFDGINEEVDLPAESFSQKVFDNISGEAWVYWEGPNEDGKTQSGIWGATVKGGDTLNNHFEIRPNGELRLRLGAIRMKSEEIMIEPKRWYHLAFSHDSSEKSITNGVERIGVSRIYIDGVKVAERYNPTGGVLIYKEGWDDSTHKIGNSHKIRYFKGKISD